MRTALSVAGFDPTSGAGVMADVKVFRSLKVYGLGVVSSVTAQSTLGMEYAEPVSRSVFRKQLSTLLDDIVPDAVKAGMVYDKGLIKIVCSEIDNGRMKPVVVDPVILSSTGKRLIKKDAFKALVHELIPRSTVVTPNMGEASALAGIEIRGVDEMYKAAEVLRRMGPGHVVVTGGHLKRRAVDVMYDGKKFHEYRTEKIRGWYHGTGCIFSAALTAGLATGKTVHESVKQAKAVMKRVLERSVQVGKGMKLLGI